MHTAINYVHTAYGCVKQAKMAGQFLLLRCMSSIALSAGNVEVEYNYTQNLMDLGIKFSCS